MSRANRRRRYRARAKLRRLPCCDRFSVFIPFGAIAKVNQRARDTCDPDKLRWLPRIVGGKQCTRCGKMVLFAANADSVLFKPPSLVPPLPKFEPAWTGGMQWLRWGIR